MFQFQNGAVKKIVWRRMEENEEKQRLKAAKKPKK